jgi:hypothetical protein
MIPRQIMDVHKYIYILNECMNRWELLVGGGGGGDRGYICTDMKIQYSLLVMEGSLITICLYLTLMYIVMA